MLLDYDELDRLWRMLLIQTPHLTDRCLLPTRVDRQRARSPRPLGSLEAIDDLNSRYGLTAEGLNIDLGPFGCLTPHEGE